VALSAAAFGQTPKPPDQTTAAKTPRQATAKNTSQNAAEDTEFSVAVAERVLTLFRRALIDENPRRALAVFDDAMAGYADLQAQLESLFRRYDTVRVYAHVTNTTAANANAARGVATVDFAMEATPPDSSYLPVRRTGELRVTFARTGKQWKIVELEPLNFFANF
jgi:hypothetical protein